MILDHIQAGFKVADFLLREHIYSPKNARLCGHYYFLATELTKLLSKMWRVDKITVKLMLS